MSSNARIDLRIDPEIKKLAERATLLSGSKNLSDFVVQAIREKALLLIEQQHTIELANQDFDAFIKAFQKSAKPNSKLKKAAKRYDQNGFS